MASFFEMPSISPTMEVGTLVEWKLKEGDSFTPQTVIAEVGTDKANMEAEVFDEGVLLKTLIEEGDEVPPGFPIAIIGTKKGEDISKLLAEFEDRKKHQAEASTEAENEPEPEPEPDHDHDHGPAAPEIAGITRSWHGKELPPTFLDPPGDLRAAAPAPARVLASPLARAVAADKGIDLHHVRGTGPGGRIVEADVESASARGVLSGPTTLATPPDEVVKVSLMRKTIAKRLAASHTEIPSFYLTVVFDMTRMVSLHEGLKEALPDAHISYNDVLIACVGRALREFPEANASWQGKTIVRHGAVDVGMAVAMDEGLITPVIRGADQKSLAQIAAETRDLAERARAGKLAEREYKGGTYTVSNLGMMQIEEFTAIINPPETGILAVGALQQVPVVTGGALGVGWRMKATMTCDHRVIDGMVGARFLKVLRKYVENPFLLVV